MAIAFQYLVKMPNGDTEIANRGIRVWTIRDCRASGDTPEAIASGYELPIAAVYEALAYAAEHPDEMDAIDQANAAVTRELLSRLPEELRHGIDLP
ncbi:MAG: hypothetical protein QOF51_3993 [Chloroflexota bacterium]|jgi:uncharacterized protein (DUF433 family)|nr:hypothetical protein [Chloroflexota bacterium]